MLHLFTQFESSSHAALSAELAQLCPPAVQTWLARAQVQDSGSVDKNDWQSARERLLATWFALPSSQPVAHYQAWSMRETALEAADCKPNPDTCTTPSNLPTGVAAPDNAASTLDGLPVGLVTPVHLAAGLDRVTLLTSEDLQVSADEANELFAIAAQVAQQQGWQLRAMSPALWVVAHPSLQDVLSPTPARAARQDVRNWAEPLGNTRAWWRLAVQVQMLWNQLPLQAKRQQQGLPVINSPWLSGCGQLKPLHPPHLDWLQSDDPLLVSLAQASQLPVKKPLAMHQQLEALSALPGNGLVSLEIAGLQNAAEPAWLDAMQQLFAALLPIAANTRNAPAVLWTLCQANRWTTLRLGPLSWWQSVKQQLGQSRNADPRSAMRHFLQKF